MAWEAIPFTPSGNIAGVEYDGDNQQLRVTFRSGYQYVYEGVPGDVAAGFGQSLSANEYLRTFVANEYQYTRTN